MSVTLLSGCIYHVGRNASVEAEFRRADELKKQGDFVGAAELYRRAEQMQKEHRKQVIKADDEFYSRKVTKMVPWRLEEYYFKLGEIDFDAAKREWHAPGKTTDLFLKLMKIQPDQIDKLTDQEILWAFRAAVDRKDLVEYIPDSAFDNAKIRSKKKEVRNRALIQAVYPDVTKRSRVLTGEETRVQETMEAPKYKVITEDRYPNDR